MKYLKTYEGLTKWAHLYDKLTNLFNIIGYKGYHMPSFSSSYNLDLNLIAIPGSISYCIIQKRMQEYEDPEITELYENPNNTLFARTEDNTHYNNNKLSFNINDDEPELAYPKIINEVIEKLKPLGKIRVSLAMDTHITEIMTLQISLLQANKFYNKEILIPNEVCNELIRNIQGYKMPHKLMVDMQKNQPILFPLIKKIIGDTNTNDAIGMHGMGYSD
jgi:hypothetical protein